MGTVLFKFSRAAYFYYLGGKKMFFDKKTTEKYLRIRQDMLNLHMPAIKANWKAWIVLFINLKFVYLSTNAML